MIILTADLRPLTSDCSASGSVDREHLEADNVLGPIYKAFGEELWPPCASHGVFSMPVFTRTR